MTEMLQFSLKEFEGLSQNTPTVINMCETNGKRKSQQ